MTKNIMKRACILGFPVAHSLSPRLHGHWLRRYGIDGAYTALETRPTDLRDRLSFLKDEGFAGCNLTMPLKRDVLPLLDALDESGLAAGAANTVVIENGRATGSNTDGFGFVEGLKAAHPNWDAARVVVLGAGGAARGVVAALRGAGARDFILVNRTPETARETAAAVAPEAEVRPWDDRHATLKDAALLVNCTSLGMAGQPPLDMDLSLLPETACVCDIVYRPLRTPLLLAAEKRGLKTVEGLPMLLHQGRPGFRLWFGRDPEVTAELYAEMKEAAA